MLDSEYGKLIVEAVRPINREYYADKLKYWIVKSDIGTERNAELLTKKIFDEQVPENKEICKGRLATSMRCTKPAKCNGYCGFHQKQYKPPVGSNVNGNRIARPQNVPTLL